MKPSNLLFVMLGAASSAALAQSSPSAPAEPPPVARQPAVVEARSENGFTYVCGGVGEVEEAQLKSRARDFDMMLTFATKAGEYLADVNVNIEDAKGDAQLHALCGGPIMLVDVPKSGTYRVHAESGGYTLNRTARVNTRKHATDALVMHWPSQIGLPVEATSTGSNIPADRAGSGGAPGNANAGERSDMPQGDQPAGPAPATPQ